MHCVCGALHISDNGCVRVGWLEITIAHENNNKNCEMATAFIVGSFHLCQKQLHGIRLIAIRNWALAVPCCRRSPIEGASVYVKKKKCTIFAPE